MASDVEVKSFLKDGKNGTSLLCQRCSSIILRPNLAVFTEKEVKILSIFVLWFFVVSYRDCNCVALLYFKAVCYSVLLENLTAVRETSGENLVREN